MPSSCNMLILAVNNFSHSGVGRFTSNSSVQLAMAWCFTAIKVQAAGCWFSKQKKVSTLPNYSHQSQILSCLGDQNQVSSVGDQASEELRAIESRDDKKWEMVRRFVNAEGLWVAIHILGGSALGCQRQGSVAHQSWGFRSGWISYRW